MSAELAKALVAAQKEMPAVEKTGKSNFGAHITLDHLIASTRKHLAGHGLTVAQFPCVLDTGQPGLRTVLMHQSGESLSADAPLFLGERHTMQALGAALTYARRQGWASVLGISTEDDDDADSISLPKEKPAEKSAKQEKTGFTDPTGEPRSDAQAKLLFQLATKLTKSGAITLEQLLKAGEGVGVEGAEGIQSLAERVTKGQASNLIERLMKLEKNTAEKAAA